MNDLLQHIMKVLVVFGPTAIGKSKLALELARRYGGEIISADSMQIYKGFDIISNKPTKEERNICPHHLLGFVDPFSEHFSVVDFRNQALPLLKEIHSRDKLPVVVGGTNYYIESLLWNFLLNPAGPLDNKHTDSDTERNRWSFTHLPNSELFDLLKQRDPEYAVKIHPNNRRKLLRGLEICEQYQKTPSQLLKEQHNDLGTVNTNGFTEITERLSGSLRFPNACFLVLDCAKEVLRERIDSRVDEMVSHGLADELLAFYSQYELRVKDVEEKSMDHYRGILQMLGVKEFLSWLRCNDKQSDEAVRLFKEGIEQLKVATRQYASSQVRWINRRLIARGRADLPKYGVFQLDATDVSKWSESVLNPALSIVDAWLKDIEPTHPSMELPSQPKQRKTIEQACDICGGVRFIYEDVWQSHLKGRRHKRNLARLVRKKKRAQEKDKREAYFKHQLSTSISVEPVIAETSPTIMHNCLTCSAAFPSRSKLFQHLNEADHHV